MNVIKPLDGVFTKNIRIQLLKTIISISTIKVLRILIYEPKHYIYWVFPWVMVTTPFVPNQSKFRKKIVSKDIYFIFSMHFISHWWGNIEKQTNYWIGSVL